MPKKSQAKVGGRSRVPKPVDRFTYYTLGGVVKKRKQRGVQPPSHLQVPQPPPPPLAIPAPAPQKIKINLTTYTQNPPVNLIPILPANPNLIQLVRLPPPPPPQNSGVTDNQSLFQFEYSQSPEDPTWEHPTYSDKQWLWNNSRHCHVCDKDFDNAVDAHNCVTGHSAEYLRCNLCFTVIKGSQKSLNNHFLIRHRNSPPYTCSQFNHVNCPHCGCNVAFELVAEHMIQHFPKLPVTVASPTFRESPPLHRMSPEAKQFLQEINANDFPRSFLSSGVITAQVLSKSSEVYQNILAYVKNSQCHSNYGVHLLEVLELSRNVKQNGPPPVISHVSTKMMLWHGTKKERVRNILENGFALPEPKQQMFGQGIYFADRVTKAANYCHYEFTTKPGTDGYLFLCEVELGRMFDAHSVNHICKRAPIVVYQNGEVVKYDSLWCHGENVPDGFWGIKTDGVTWSIGSTVRPKSVPAFRTIYNEWAVYNPNQIKIRYLVKVRSTPGPFYDYK